MNYTTWCMACGNRMKMNASKCTSCGADYYGQNDIDPPRQTIPTPFTKDSNTYSNDASVHERELDIDFSKFISASELEAIVGAKVQGIQQTEL